MSFLLVLLGMGVIAPVLTVRHVDSSATSPNKEACLRIASKVCHISGNTTSSVNILHLHQSGRSDPTNDIIFNALIECLWQRSTPVLIYNQSAVTEPVDYTTFNVFLVPSGDEGPAFVQTMLRHRLHDNQHSKHEHQYVFVWPGASDRQLAKLFDATWLKSRILNLLAVKGERGLSEPSVHTYEPFSSQGFRTVVLPPNTTHFFYDKLGNLYGAPFRISIFNDSIRAIARVNSETQGFDAVDGIMAETVVRHLNATGTYVTPQDDQNYGKCLADGSFSGSYGDVINRRTEAAFNMRYVFECTRPYIEQLYPYRKRVFYLVVPSAPKLPQYLIFVSSSSKVMGLFLVMLPGFLIMQHWVRRIYPADELDMPRLTWIEAAMMFLRTQWGQPVERYSRIGSLRFYLITWILYCYVLTTIYIAKMESSFVHPHYEPEVDALNDLARLNVSIYGLNGNFEILNGSLERHKYELIMSKAKPLPLDMHPRPYPLLMWRADKNAAFVLRHDMAKVFVVQSFNVAEKRPNYHIVREHLRSIPFAYIVDRGSPYRYKLEQIERHLHEGGLMDHWLEQSLQRSLDLQEPDGLDAVGGEELPEFDHEDGNEAAAPYHSSKVKQVLLTMEILQGAFYLWAGGVSAAVLSFAGELLHRRLRVWSRAKRVDEALP